MFKINSHTLRANNGRNHRRRLVINIGGRANSFGSQILGGAKIVGKYVFRQHSKKNVEKNPKIPFYSLKFITTLFLVIDNLFQKCIPLIQNVLPFLCIFLSLSLFLLS